jgi:hypothetical protein
LRDLWQSGFAKGNSYTVKVRGCATGNLSVSAIKMSELAKNQRVPLHASLIYKTVFLLLQKRGSKIESESS